MPISTAALVALRRRRAGTPAASPRGGGLPGTSFIPEVPDARVSVEIAWAADLTGSPDTWSWTTITNDVRVAEGITTRLGRSDESSTSNPAELTIMLNNPNGDYSLGGLSRFYPYVRLNTPVRVRVDPGTGPRTICFGFLAGLFPSWDSITGKIPVVKLTAGGALRRLSQGASAVYSPIHRYLVNATSVVAYWPCEAGSAANSFPVAVGTRDMVWTGTPNLGSNTDFAGSLALPTTNAVTFRGPVDSFTQYLSSDSSQSVRMLMALPASTSAPANNSILFRVFMSGGTVGRFDLVYGTGAVFTVVVYDTSGTQLASFGATFSVDATPGLISLEMFQSGASFFYGLNYLRNDRTTYGSISGSPTGVGTLGIVSQVVVDPNASITGMGFGHVAVLNARSATDPLTDVYNQVHGWTGEIITDTSGRLHRLCTENSISITQYGGASDSTTAIDYTGPQDSDTIINLLRTCETQERGVLWDGLDAGLAYTTRRRHENASPLFTIDAAAGELSAPFSPMGDDQRIRNQWTVSRDVGAEFTVKDSTGPLGTTTVGTYDDSLTINSYDDWAARNLADWLVHVGTVEGYRYSTLTIDLRAVPRLITLVVDLIVGSRVDIVNLNTTLTGTSETSVALTVESIAWEIGPDRCYVTLTCSPFDVWRVDVLAADSGDTADFLSHLDTNGSTLAASYPVGTTSISVATTSGPLWTTTADDFPFYLVVGGVQVRATACSGASSPQTFTVDALSVARNIGSAVALSNESALGL